MQVELLALNALAPLGEAAGVVAATQEAVADHLLRIMI